MNSELNEKTFWDSYAKHYDRLLRKLSGVYGIIREKALELTFDYSVVLEAGTGTGDIAFAVSGKALSVEACDLSPAMIHIAEQKHKKSGSGNLRFSVCDCCEMNYPDMTFDLVIVSNVLHVIPDPEAALTEASRVLKPDGVIFAPTYLHGENLISKFFSRIMSLKGFRAYSRWSRSSLQCFLIDRGFKVMEMPVIKGTIPLGMAVLKKGDVTEVV